MAIPKFGFTKRSKQSFQAFVVCAIVAVMVTAFYLSRSSMEQITSNGWSIAFAFVLCMAVVLIRFIQYRTMNDDFERFRSEYKQQQRKVNFSGDPEAKVDMSGFKFKSYRYDYVEFALAFGIIAIGLSDIIISGMKGTFDTTRLIVYLLMAFTYGTGTQWSNAVFDGIMASVKRELGIDIEENNPSPSISAMAFDADGNPVANAEQGTQGAQEDEALVAGNELSEVAEPKALEAAQEEAEQAEDAAYPAADEIAGAASEESADDAAEDGGEEEAEDDGPDLDYDDEEVQAFNEEHGIFEINMDELDAAGSEPVVADIAETNEAGTMEAEQMDPEKE